MLRIITIIITTWLPALVYASDCDFSDQDFPSNACSFTNPLTSVDVTALKFGKINKSYESEGVIALGANHFQVIPNETIILDAGNTTACIYNQNIFDDDEIGQDIAFTIDSNEPRKITRLWLLRCNNYQAR